MIRPATPVPGPDSTSSGPEPVPPLPGAGRRGPRVAARWRIALLALAAAPGCHEGITGPLVESVARPVATGLLLDVVVDREILVPADTLHVRVVLSNPTDRPVSLTRSWGCALGFTVETPDGIPVRPAPACRSVSFETVLEPGARMERDFEWTAEREVGDPPLRVGVPGGPYRIFAVLTGPNEERSGFRTVIVRYPPD